jgi:polynucleotide 5'-hydroxyl-kinase GRC3/NOL9
MSLERIEEVKGYCILEGPLRVKLIEGEVQVTGKRLSTKEEVVIPSAKATLMEAPCGAKVELRGGGTLTKLDSSTIPRGWVEVLDSVGRGPRVVFTLGCVDSGKTFFVTYVANELFERGVKVSVVDCDVGQSNIGPPTTIGLGILERQVAFLEEVPVLSAYFVGSTSPAGHLLPMVVGTAKLVNQAKGLSDVVLIDTPGMVYGGPARAYQLYAVEALSPDVVVALQRGGELEHLTRQLKALGHEVVELPASAWVRQRDRGDRRALRERAFYNYFSKRGVVNHILSLDKVTVVGSFMGSGRVASQEVVSVVEAMAGSRVEYCELSQDSVVIVLEDRPSSRDFYSSVREVFKDRAVRAVVKGFERGLVVGLMSEKGEFLDVGVLKGLDFKGRRATVVTPLKSVEGVRALKLGCVRLGEEYQEVEKLEPGFV